jgi:hypothetical protein
MREDRHAKAERLLSAEGGGNRGYWVRSLAVRRAQYQQGRDPHQQADRIGGS